MSISELRKLLLRRQRDRQRQKTKHRQSGQRLLRLNMLEIPAVTVRYGEGTRLGQRREGYR